MPDVFLSYRNTEKRRAIVRRLATALRAYDLTVWWDCGLEAGEAYRERILQELRTSKVVVPLWCSESVASQWVIHEATIGHERGTLCPARLQQVSPPTMFEGIHASDLIGWDGAIDSPRLREFIQTLGSLLGKEPRAPRDMLEELAALPPIEPLESMKEVAEAESFRVFSHYGLLGNQAHAKRLIETTGPIDIMGLSLLSFHRESDEPLRTAIRARAKDKNPIRVLIADPENEVGLTQIVHENGSHTLANLQMQIRQSVAEWRQLAAIHPNFEVRLLRKAVIRHVATITKETAVVSFYWFAAPASTDRPSLVCKPSSVFYELIRSEFDALWGLARKVT